MLSPAGMSIATLVRSEFNILRVLVTPAFKTSVVSTARLSSSPISFRKTRLCACRSVSPRASCVWPNNLALSRVTAAWLARVMARLRSSSEKSISSSDSSSMIPRTRSLTANGSITRVAVFDCFMYSTSAGSASESLACTTAGRPVSSMAAVSGKSFRI